MLRILIIFRPILALVFAELIWGYWGMNRLQAQDPVFSQYMLNQLYFNPAFAGNTPYPRLILGYRNQWPGLSNAYVDYYASYDQYSDALGGGVGFGLTRDVQGNGIFSRTTADIMYSYPVEINDDMAANFGIQASIVQKSVKGSGVILGDQNPFLDGLQGEVIPDQSNVFPDFSAGISFLYKKQYQVNFSVHHLNTPNEMTGTDNAFHTPMRYTVQGLAQFPAPRKTNRNTTSVIFKPGFMVQAQKSSLFTGWGGNINYSVFSAGLWFRNNISFNLNTFILLAGYTQSGFSVYYSYDYWMMGNNQHYKNYGAHEVTFIYLFQYNDPRKKMRTIKCPKI